MDEVRWWEGGWPDHLVKDTLYADIRERGPVAMDGGGGDDGSLGYFHLDAENLAEEHFGTSFFRVAGHLLRHDPFELYSFRIKHPPPRRYGPSMFTVEVNGRVYEPIDAEEYTWLPAWHWATELFFRVVNDVFSPGSSRFFAIGKGNDLGGIELPLRLLPFFWCQAGNPIQIGYYSSCPYVPVARPPWYFLPIA